MRHVTLTDRYDLDQSAIVLSGTQALVRLMLMQKARDRAAGLNTAGYVSGYRGSPLGAVDRQMSLAKATLEAADVLFQPGLNEDLAATAIWGTQSAGLRGQGRYDGVFGLWYGKGPGVDRSGDALRHANLAGSAAQGGVVLAMGDDHVGESSTTCHQSDFAAVDARIPVLSPAGVQEILDFGLYGYALSRFSGLWTGLKLMKDTVEVTSVVDGDPARMAFVAPEFELPPGGLNLRDNDHWTAQEERLIVHKVPAAKAFARANGIDGRKLGKRGARIGLVAAGKNWLDLCHALSLLGIDAGVAEQLGITAYKVGQTWPLEPEGILAWAEGLDLIVVVEEKRKLIEVQIREILFDDRRGRRVCGAQDPHGGGILFPSHYTLDPVGIAARLARLLQAEGILHAPLETGLRRMEAALAAESGPDLAARKPNYCAGCPHNTSTVVPPGSRAYAGIGCHTMALWMDRATANCTHMGAEGSNWVGEAPFSKLDHVFANMGDGTYNHSGMLSVRAALAAGTPITFKILFNDAVALTGGQGNDGGLTPERVVAELRAMGVTDIALVFDPAEEPHRGDYPRDILWEPRENLMAVQEKYRQIKGVSAIVYVQTCATEKRRRRKRGRAADPDLRVLINPEICEGCGDCGAQSNCAAIVPLETPLGRKRAIDQSLCNKDISCLKGFCPSFVTIQGGRPRPAQEAGLEIGDLPEPEIRPIEGTCNIVVAGIGGHGVVTLGALLATAAHMDGKGAGMMEMAGLAQRGGAVLVHCRLAEEPRDITAIRVAAGECDLLIGGDLVVAGARSTLGLLEKDRSQGVLNSHEVMTGDFARQRDFAIPVRGLRSALEARLGTGMTIFDASALSRQVLGDTVFACMVLLGAAWQQGRVPLSRAAILRAIELNETAVAANTRAFDLGRWAALHPGRIAEVSGEDAAAAPATLEDLIAHRATHLELYQSRGLAQRYLRALSRIGAPELRRAVAEGYHKLLSYKDEYEVARLLQASRALAQEAFDGDLKLRYHLAPPMLSRAGPDGRPRKRAFGRSIERLAPWLARLKLLRGTPFDPFGYSRERRAERALIRDYETDLAAFAAGPANLAAAVALARLPLEIRGFGPVKQEAMAQAAPRRVALRRAMSEPVMPREHAAE